MENCSFRSQLLSVMEVLAKAAVGEINRRVDDSCAVLRLEVRQSRQDIDLLKKKCEVMEAELRRSRMRARRKAAEGFSPLVKVVLNRERPNPDWDRPMDAEAQNHLQQCSDEANDVHTPIKEECAEEAAWTNDAEDTPGEQLPCFDVPRPPQSDGFAEHHQSAEDPAFPGSVFSPTDPFATFPEPQLSRIQNEAELSVKHEREEEADESAAPLDPAHRSGTEEGDGQLWSSGPGRYAVDPSFSHAGQQCEPIPSVQPSQSGSLSEDMAPQIHPVGKSHSLWVSAARAKRRARLFGCKRPPTDDGRNVSPQVNAADPRWIPQQPQHQSRGSSPLARHAGEGPTPPSTSAGPFYRHSRGSFGLARRARTPWRPAVGEKRFSCTYCDKGFVRFCQLKEHLRSHTGEKPFSCPLCGRSFTKQCNLIRHAVVHSGEKPYECSLCGKCFTQRSSLTSHQRSAH